MIESHFVAGGTSFDVTTAALQNRDATIYRIKSPLLKDGRARLKDCKSQKTGKTYNADILLSTEADGRPQFSMEFDKRKGGGK